MDTEEMQRQLQALTDRAEIADLMDRYLRSLDDGDFDEEWARAFHTEDVVIHENHRACDCRPRRGQAREVTGRSAVSPRLSPPQTHRRVAGVSTSTGRLGAAGRILDDRVQYPIDQLRR